MAHHPRIIVVFPEGNVEGVMDRPPDNDARLESERQKWDAWFDQRNLSRTEAKRRYITVLIGVMRKYACSTPEAEELISELEFVWNQVRENTARGSSAAKSRGRPPLRPPVPPHQQLQQSPPQQQRRRRGQATAATAPGSGPGTGAGVSSGPSADAGEPHLRVLSPQSQLHQDSRHAHGIGSSGSLDGDEDEDDDDGDGEETFEEARDSFYDDEVQSDYGNYDSHYNDPAVTSASHGPPPIELSEDKRSASASARETNEDGAPQPIRLPLREIDIDIDAHYATSRHGPRQ
ncbi:hypothetical protein KEM52_000737 [Ascosphaera acerosa]|nr:hypothetical protein KEM52_000737 [Ascosphaera acerosa]